MSSKSKLLKKTQAFKKALLEWQLHLSGLNVQAPLREKYAQIIWQNVNAEIQ